METLLKISPLLNLCASIILVIVTGIYVFLTKRILEATKQQSKLSLAPSVGINIKSINISEVFGPNRRNMRVGLELTNVGNAPAIEVIVDSEVEYRHSNINGEKWIPSRFEPDVIPFLTPGDTVDKCHPSYGNKFITHFFDDARESKRLNLHRIETAPSQESYKTSRLYIYCYYRNALGQLFKSSYDIEIGLDPFSNENIPSDDETCEVVMSYIPRPSFHVEPITSEAMETEILLRNSKRKLCGW